MKKYKLGFLSSHGGSNMQAIIDACKIKKLNMIPTVIISNNSKSQALKRARIENIPYFHLNSKTHSDSIELDNEIKNKLIEHNVDIIILAGYMKIIGLNTLSYFRNKILNIHPALLPKFGGKGMYGRHVHEAVLAAGEKITGVTIHIVNEEYDSGPIINQCQLPVYENDTVDTLSERVLEREHEFFVETLQKISERRIKLK